MLTDLEAEQLLRSDLDPLEWNDDEVGRVLAMLHLADDCEQA